MSEWIVDRRPTAEDADQHSLVIAWFNDTWVGLDWQRVADEGFPWMHCPEPYVAPERQFADGATYSNPKLWVDAEGYLWKGPTNPDDNLHFARCEGVCKADGSLIWVAYTSELPSGCVLYASYENAPIDTSLAASLKRSGQPSLCQKQPCICEFCDRHRIIEAAKRWDEYNIELIKRCEAVIENPGSRWDSTEAFVAACKASSEVKKIESVADINNFQDALIVEGYAIQSLDHPKEVKDDGADVLVVPHKRKPLDLDGPSNGSEPGASGSNEPLKFSGSSHSVVEAELPDPGEGWELCRPDQAEQWLDGGVWVGGRKFGEWHRRRVVMRVMPKGDGPCWRLDREERSWVASELRIVRLCWNSDETLAWCHRLDGEQEQEPPQFALDWAKNK